MSCSNCFNGCDKIVSDKCIRYSGVDVEVLGIKNGDSLSYVEQAIVEFLTSTLDGTGIIPTIASEDLCTLISGYLPTCGDITIVDLVTACIKSACDLQEQVTDIVGDVAAINASYTVSCLTGVTASSGAHAILQAVITKLCATDTIVTALALDVTTNYVRASDINQIIADYLTSISATTLVSSKMIPYAAVEYYGSLSYFDATGAGTGNWINVYLCNGNNGTPDKRGRVPVGTTVGMGGGAYATAVDPAISGNPSYSLLGVGGANTIILTVPQIPVHSHTAVVTITDPGHFHYEFSPGVSGIEDIVTAADKYPRKGNSTDGPMSYSIYGVNDVSTLGKSSYATTGISMSVVNVSVGSNTSHSNIQPVLACHYIIYIP